MNPTPRKQGKRRLDDLLLTLVPDGSGVLDLGCGDGWLLAELIERHNCRGRGIDIDEAAVRACIARGVPVYHGDMMEGMANYPDGTFDVVILGQTLQQTTYPVAVIREMLRVGRRAVISFPNFGHWGVRLQLLSRGHMPRSRLLPYAWHDTPNVHLCTVADFRDLCAAEDLETECEIGVSPSGARIIPWAANLRAATAIFQLRRRQTPARECPL
jgi:methionine biosynthesis protein MetW